MTQWTSFANLNVDAASSWRGKSILSLDIDWACDEVLTYALDLIEAAGIPATFFATHPTPLLDRIRANGNFELGTHPNFNPLFEGTANDSSVASILEQLKLVVPEATVVRSHSLTTSGRWLEQYRDAGFRVCSNYMMPGVESISPFRHVNGLVEVPIYFADDGLLLMREQGLQDREIGGEFHESEFHGQEFHEPEGLRVYNFHPIHIALNSKSLASYNQTRELHHDFDALMRQRIEGEDGVEAIFKRLIH